MANYFSQVPTNDQGVIGILIGFIVLAPGGRQYFRAFAAKRGQGADTLSAVILTNPEIFKSALVRCPDHKGPLFLTGRPVLWGSNAGCGTTADQGLTQDFVATLGTDPMAESHSQLS